MTTTDTTLDAVTSMALQVKELARRRALEKLAKDFEKFSLEQLRWDWGCNIHQEARDLILAELRRRGVSMAAFERLGRGKRRE
jgi:hypothetical protein